ncbi:MAG: hypothetical protein ACR2ID_10185 [Chthoniobacterales bacterium]
MSLKIFSEFPFKVLFANQFVGQNMQSTPDSKLIGFLNLAEGWYNGFGKRISNAAVGDALHIVRTANGGSITGTDVFPRPDGGVTVAVYFDRRDLAFNIKPDRTIDVDSETDANFPLLEKLSLRHALFIIQGLRQQWNLSSYSTYPSTTSNSVGFGVPVSRIPGMERVSQFSFKNAPRQQAAPYAVMPALSMAE